MTTDFRRYRPSARRYLNVAANSFAMLSPAFVQWAIIILLTRWTTLEKTGQYILAQSLTAPLFMAAGLQMRNLASLAEFSSDDEKNLFFVRISTTLGALLLTALLFSFTDLFALIATFAAYRTHDQIQDYIYGTYVARGMFVRLALSQLCRQGAYLSSAAILIASGAGITLVAATSVLFGLVGCMFVDWEFYRVRILCRAGESPLATLGGCRSATQLLKKIYGVGIAAGINSSRSTLFRYLLARCGGDGALAVFSCLQYIPLTFQLASASVAQTFIVEHRAVLRRSSAEYRRVLVYLCIAAGLMGYTVYCIGNWGSGGVLSRLYNPTVARYRSSILYLAIALVLICISNALNDALLITVQYRRLVLASCGAMIAEGAMIVTCVTSFRSGVENGCIAAAVGAAVQCLVLGLGLSLIGEAKR